MSAVQINYDTVTKNLEMTLDGNTVDNIEAIELFNFYSDENNFSLRCVKHEEFPNDGHSVKTIIMAKDEGHKVTKKSFKNETEEHYYNVLNNNG